MVFCRQFLLDILRKANDGSPIGETNLATLSQGSRYTTPFQTYQVSYKRFSTWLLPDGDFPRVGQRLESFLMIEIRYTAPVCRLIWSNSRRLRTSFVLLPGFSWAPEYEKRNFGMETSCLIQASEVNLCALGMNFVMCFSYPVDTRVRHKRQVSGVGCLRCQPGRSKTLQRVPIHTTTYKTRPQNDAQNIPSLHTFLQGPGVDRELSGALP